METAHYHEASESFPTPQEFIDSIPGEPSETEHQKKQREAEAQLNAKAQKVNEGGVKVIFKEIITELKHLDMMNSARFSEKIKTKYSDNLDSYTKGTENYKIFMKGNHIGAKGYELGNTNITVEFGQQITVTYSSAVEGYTEIEETTEVVRSLLELRDTLNSRLDFTNGAMT